MIKNFQQIISRQSESSTQIIDLMASNQSKVALIQKTSNLTNIQYPHHQHYKTKRLSLFWILTIQGISYQFTIHPGNSRHYKPLQYIWLFWMLTIQEISYQFTIHPGNSRHYKT